MAHLNDPKINRKYNYIYKITNLVNDKIYIGVHRTDKLEDNYMGSGKMLKRSIRKYGVENFKKTILEYFDTYQEALDRERELVTMEFIENNNTYNIREGGYGNCRFSSEMIARLSITAKERWSNPEYRVKMMIHYNNEDRCRSVSNGIKKWIKDNPELHQVRMDKINKNPEKIKKMADTHRGMIRSDIAKSNISEGIRNFLENDPLSSEKRGKGSIYIHNKEDGKIKRIPNTEDIPEGWIKGFGPRKKQ